MRELVLLLSLYLVVVAPTAAWGVVIDPDIIVRRGDSNQSGSVDASDAIHILSYLYQGGPAPDCLNQADSNDDGLVDQSDTVYLLSWLFGAGAPPPAPGPYATGCTMDPDPNPGCVSLPCS